MHDSLLDYLGVICQKLCLDMLKPKTGKAQLKAT